MKAITKAITKASRLNVVTQVIPGEKDRSPGNPGDWSRWSWIIN